MNFVPRLPKSFCLRCVLRFVGLLLPDLTLRLRFCLRLPLDTLAQLYQRPEA